MNNVQIYRQRPRTVLSWTGAVLWAMAGSAQLVAVGGCGFQPALDAGIDQSASAGETVTLTATNASTAQLSSFLWEQLSGPAVAINNAGTTQATFTAPIVDEPTELVFQVTAFSSLGSIDVPVFGEAFDLSTNINVPAVDTITVIVQPAEAVVPVASAGNDQIVTEGSQVTLDGTRSSDLAGGRLTYFWQQIAGSSVDLASVNTVAQPIFTAPEASGTSLLEFELTVTTESGLSAADVVTVVVIDSPASPVAIISGEAKALEGATATYSGVGSTDPGDEPLTFLWEQIDENFDITLPDPASEIISFTLPTVTQDMALMLRLTVTNRTGRSDTATFTTTVQPYPAPIANAGTDQVIDEGAMVTLNASGSSDPAGGKVTFLWTVPTISLSLSSNAIEGPIFTAPAVSSDQAYTLTLTVTNEQGDPASDTVVITIRNI